ncbi:MAG: DUF2891 domain-containing protein [Terriglobales bacterium]
MKTLAAIFLMMLALASAQSAPQRTNTVPSAAHSTDLILAERFAKLALACVHQEYPNKIAHVMNSDGDLAPPRKLTPAFYGCYDWHSSVHGHWMLARLARQYGRRQPPATSRQKDQGTSATAETRAVSQQQEPHPKATPKTTAEAKDPPKQSLDEAPASLPATAAEPEFIAKARTALRQSITRENIAEEVAYLNAKGRASFERPYGLAWLLQLGAELREWSAEEQSAARVNIQPGSGVNGIFRAGDGPADLSKILRPLEEAAVVRLKTWLPKLSHPLRTGEHSQTAFALGLMLDYAKVSGDKEFERLLVDKALAFYLHDKACPLNYEPGGEDFMSPCLAEADVMRRVLAPEEYGKWLRGFLPVLFAAVSRKGIAPRPWLEPAVVTDPTDGKLAHLDGLNLSRAWMLEGMAAGLDTSALRPLEQARVGHVNTQAMWKLQGAAKAQRDAGLAAVTGEHYEGGHWLGSFAVYLVTRRGILTTENTESHRGKQDKSK